MQLVSAGSDTPRILHLADMLSQLVSQRRFEVLPELMKAGGAYCDLTKGRLMVLVEKLQPQVEQLAQALSLELVAGSQLCRRARCGSRPNVCLDRRARRRAASPSLGGSSVYRFAAGSSGTDPRHAGVSARQPTRDDVDRTRAKLEALARAARTDSRRTGGERDDRRRDRHRGTAASSERGPAPLPCAATWAEPRAGGIEHDRNAGSGGSRNCRRKSDGSSKLACRTSGAADTQADFDHRVAAGGHAAGIRAATGGRARQRSARGLCRHPTSQGETSKRFAQST